MKWNEEFEKGEQCLREEKILEFWEKEEIFKKSLDASKGNPLYVFYDGPPTANGRPGIHHLEARSFKDAIPRYKTMRGFHVARRAGWDTHGLPVELEVEKRLGITSKKEIEDFGIEKFNEECKKSVWTYVDEWADFTKRTGYWVDLQNPYVTYSPEFVETAWRVFAESEKKGLLYKDYKVLPWCARCGTALSSHELAQGYENVKDLSVTIAFTLLDESDTYVLAWTTTPWTLPGNVGLAVGSEIDYVTILLNGKKYILAKDRLEIVSGEYEIVAHYKGSELVGKRYIPLYSFMSELITGEEAKKLENNAYMIYPASFVTTADGTGIVHTAVMYGQEDFELGTCVGLPKFHLVNQEGHFIEGCGFLSGRFVKDENVAIDIVKDLAKREVLFSKEKYEHSYPHCWRCKTPLLYYARDSWYIAMSKLRDEMMVENDTINWEPAHVRAGRFGEWILNIKDWAVSRERYWGTPLPAWVSSDGQKRIVVDSYETLKSKIKRSGNKYIFVRHGESENNISRTINCDPSNVFHLTEKGVEQVIQTATDLAPLVKNKHVVLLASPFTRTQETANIISQKIVTEVKTDSRLSEFNFGDFDGKSLEEFYKHIKSFSLELDHSAHNGETFRQVIQRIGAVLDELETTTTNTTYILVTHGGVIEAARCATEGADDARILELGTQRVANAEILILDYIMIPRNKKYQFDPHRPFVDMVVLVDEDGTEYKRTPEVLDVWFDSGVMPYGQYYRGETKDNLALAMKNAPYPADFICEAVDQTRGWFYTLHAVGAIMGAGKAYKNVICLGHILDDKGFKMSKSKGNIVSPWAMIAKYGVDPLRFWMYSVNQPGDSKNFDERTVDEIVKKICNPLRNIVSLYHLYHDDSHVYTDPFLSDHIMDRWILALFGQLHTQVTHHFDEYRLLDATRALREFVGEFSVWYVRRSRDRLKGDAYDNVIRTLSTMRYILKEISLLFAPVMPFFAEELYQAIASEESLLSVHLEKWSKVFEYDKLILVHMHQARDIVSEGLMLRNKAGIKVKQPLRSITISNKVVFENKDLLFEIESELNVKEVKLNENQESLCELDLVLDESLIVEGKLRECIRSIQSARKILHLTHKENKKIRICAQDDLVSIIRNAQNYLLSETNCSDVAFVKEQQKFEFEIDFSSGSFDLI